MKDHDFTAVQMYWKPALIKLTQFANPDMDDGKPTTCYVDPQLICLIQRQMTSFSKGDSIPVEYYPRGPVTAVCAGHGLTLYVTESPEEVARLRDKALGQEPKTELKSVT